MVLITVIEKYYTVLFLIYLKKINFNEMKKNMIPFTRSSITVNFINFLVIYTSSDRFSYKEKSKIEILIHILHT